MKADVDYPNTIGKRLLEDRAKQSRIDLIGQNGNDGEHYMNPAFNRPVHYSGWGVARFADGRKYDLYQFNILKYIDRHDKKDGKKDLLKA